MTVDGPGELRFLYVGTDDTDGAVARWRADLGATLRWRFRAFDADVAGLEVGADGGPLVLLADHRPAGSVLAIWSVASLERAVERLRGAGWTVAGPMGTPEGDAAVLTSPDGSEIGLLEVVRPGAMDEAYADEGNDRRVT